MTTPNVGEATAALALAIVNRVNTYIGDALPPADTTRLQQAVTDLQTLTDLKGNQ